MKKQPKKPKGKTPTKKEIKAFVDWFYKKYGKMMSKLAWE